MTDALLHILQYSFEGVSTRDYSESPAITLCHVVPRDNTETIVPSVLLNYGLDSGFKINPGSAVSFVRPFPMFVQMEPKRTVYTIMRELFTRAPTGYIERLTTNKGEVFYGCNGLLLERTMKPLMVAAKRFTRSLESDTFLPEDQIMLISPRVFYEDTILTKAIRKDFIPSLASQSLSIIISDLDDLIIQASVADPEEVNTMVRICGPLIANNLQ